MRNLRSNHLATTVPRRPEPAAFASINSGPPLRGGGTSDAKCHVAMVSHTGPDRRCARSSSAAPSSTRRKRRPRRDGYRRLVGQSIAQPRLSFDFLARVGTQKFAESLLAVVMPRRNLARLRQRRAALIELPLGRPNCGLPILRQFGLVIPRAAAVPPTPQTGAMQARFGSHRTRPCCASHRRPAPCHRSSSARPTMRAAGSSADVAQRQALGPIGRAAR